MLLTVESNELAKFFDEYCHVSHLAGKNKPHYL